MSGRISDSQDQQILVGLERARVQGVHELGTMMGHDRDSRAAPRPAARGLKSRATQTKPARSRLHPAAREGFVWVAGGFSLRGTGVRADRMSSQAPQGGIPGAGCGRPRSVDSPTRFGEEPIFQDPADHRTFERVLVRKVGRCAHRGRTRLASTRAIW